MDKSEDAFRTISEAAEELDLPQHVLRFWETRFPQIRPLKRGGGRRYYRPDDVELLRVIRHLLYNDGYTIKGVQRMLKERGVRAVLELRSQAGAESAAPQRSVAPLLEPATAQPAPVYAARVEPEPPLAAAPGAIVMQLPYDERGAPAFGGEPAFDAQPGAIGADASAASPPSHQRVVRTGLGLQDLRKLEAVIAELAECRRILAAANI